METENKIIEIPICKKVYKCEHNKRKDRCHDCGGKQICDHGKRKSYCVLCDGSELCIHKKRKTRCKECDGSEYCSHGKCKYICIDCHGTRLCEHNKIKSICRDCDGSAYCEHNKIKSRCRDCDGSAYCEHNKIKSRCKECGGSQICIHNKIKSHCIDCDGSAFCIHKKIKITCKDCIGSACCEHGKIKYNCIDCKGSSFCEHGKKKTRCKDCGGSCLCKTPLCETRASTKYEGLCLRCFIYTFPDKPVSRNYKTKEHIVADEILKSFSQFTWIADKRIQDGCSRRRPDLIMDMGSHVIIIEIDENQHNDYDTSCENRRIMEISQDIGHRPVVFIRFNPDDYIDETNTKVRSCFTIDKNGITKVAKAKQTEWNNRINCLKSHIQYWSEHETEKTVKIVHLFFDSCH